MNVDKVIKKWSPVLENVLGTKNKELIKLVSIFAEKYCVENPLSSDLPEKINEVKNKISKKRIEVKTFYNTYTCKIEYELPSTFIERPGIRINESGDIYDELSTDDIIELFGIEFARFLDKEEFRENRLNELIKDGI
jgi:hypothetical protein